MTVRSRQRRPTVRWTVFGTVVSVIRWHGSSRPRAEGAVSSNLLLSNWYGRLALLAVALGLVLMHHVVGAHQHSTEDVASSQESNHSLVDQDAPPKGGHQHGGASAPGVGDAEEHGSAPVSADGMTATGSAAVLHYHPDENGHDHHWSLLHMCLVAVVGAAVFLLVLVLVALWWRPAPPRTATGGVAPATAPRVPPASLRQAELQVLRL